MTVREASEAMSQRKRAAAGVAADASVHGLVSEEPMEILRRLASGLEVNVEELMELSERYAVLVVQDVLHGSPAGLVGILHGLVTDVFLTGHVHGKAAA